VAIDKIALALDLDPLETFEFVFEYDKEAWAKIPGAFPGWKSEEFTLEHRQNMSIAASKRIRTEEHLAKLHAGRRNSKNSKEHATAVIASRIGSSHSDEAKKKMSEKKLSNTRTKENAKLAGKISAEKRKNDPNYKLLQSQRAKAAWAKRKEGLVHGD